MYHNSVVYSNFLTDVCTRKSFSFVPAFRLFLGIFVNFLYKHGVNSGKKLVFSHFSNIRVSNVKTYPYNKIQSAIHVFFRLEFSCYAKHQYTHS